MRITTKNCSLIASAVALVISSITSAATVTAKNDLDIARPSETVVVAWRDLGSAMPAAAVSVSDAAGKQIVSQVVDVDADGKPDQLVFQADFAPGESKTFEIKPGSNAKQADMAPSKVFGRYVPERLDDFAWENDRIAFRAYGPALEKTEKPGPSGSGLDVWCKRTRNLIINKWYGGGEDSYHKDRGEGLDGYKVGHGRGCGGTGIWKDGTLYTTGNGGWRTQKVLANGPVRLVFEMTYDPIDVPGGAKVSEIKRITLDAGTNLNMIQSTFNWDGGASPIQFASGISKHTDPPAKQRFTRTRAGSATGMHRIAPMPPTTATSAAAW